jgi:hypothetical protein
MKKFMGIDFDHFWKEAHYPIDEFDFDEDTHLPADIVAIGCSFTHGVGVEESISWSEHLSNKMNLSLHRLSGGGKSTMWAINNFFSYVNRFGNPKIVVALFPEFTRMQMSSQIKHIRPKRLPQNLINHEVVSRYSIYDHYRYELGLKYFKSPLIAEEIFPPETSFDLPIQYIKMLEMYCNTNNIKLVWSTWVKDQEDWLEENVEKTQFKNFISAKTWQWHARQEDNFYERFCMYSHPDNTECYLYNNCHVEHVDDYQDNFYMPTDRKNNNKTAHWGAHRHIHLAEEFWEKLN